MNAIAGTPRRRWTQSAHDSRILFQAQDLSATPYAVVECTMSPALFMLTGMGRWRAAMTRRELSGLETPDLAMLRHVLDDTERLWLAVCMGGGVPTIPDLLAWEDAARRISRIAHVDAPAALLAPLLLGAERIERLWSERNTGASAKDQRRRVHNAGRRLRWVQAQAITAMRADSDQAHCMADPVRQVFRRVGHLVDALGAFRAAMVLVPVWAPRRADAAGAA